MERKWEENREKWKENGMKIGRKYKDNGMKIGRKWEEKENWNEK